MWFEKVHVKLVVVKQQEKTNPLTVVSASVCSFTVLAFLKNTDHCQCLMSKYNIGTLSASILYFEGTLHLIWSQFSFIILMELGTTVLLN